MKMNRTVWAIAFMFGVCITGNSQVYNDFDLKTFLMPDITRNALDFTLNSSGEVYDRESSDKDSYSISGNLGTEFKRFKNSRSFWGTQNAVVNLGGAYDKSNLYDTKNSNYDVNFSYDNTSRFYREKNFFLGIGGYAYARFNGDKKTEVTESKKDEKSLSVSVPLSIGKGRIEVVTDARQAIYILDNLNRRGVMKRNLSNDEILTLAKVIAQVKNKRFLDARHHLIDEISTVDSFFVKNDLLTTNGASYFTTLYDYWMYGDRFERLSGLVIEGSFIPGFQHGYSKRTDEGNYIDETKYKANIPLVRGKVSLTYENPVNLYWQQSGYVELNGNYLKYLYKESDYTDTRLASGGLSGYYKWGYYPTSRTNINFGVNEYFSVDSWKNDEEGAESNSSLTTRTGIFLETYYYFSPQLRLSANANLDYIYSKGLKAMDYKSSQLNASFALKLTYSLF